MTTRRNTVRWASLVAAVPLLTSCAPWDDGPPPGARGEVAPAAAAAATSGARAALSPATAPASRPLGEHWVQDWRIRAIMQAVALGSYPRHAPGEPPATQPSPDDVHRAMQDVATLADNLAVAAGEIARIVDDSALGEADRAGFVERARRLREQAAQLGAEARAGRAADARRTLDKINLTCFDCHTRYRDLTNVMDPGRALLDDRRAVPPTPVAVWAGAGTGDSRVPERSAP